MGKKLGSCLLACIIIMSLATVALAADSSAPDLKVMVDSCIVDFPDAQPQMVDGRVMLPLRQVLEILGAEVTYQDNNISITYGDTIVEFTIGYKLLDIKRGEDINSWVFDVAPYLEQGTNRVMVPVRFISEALGFNVGWDSDEKTVVIINTEKMASRLAENLQTLNYLFQLPEDYYENNYQIDEETKLTFSLEGNDTTIHFVALQVFSPSLLQTNGTLQLQITADDWQKIISYWSEQNDMELSAKDLLVLKNLRNIEVEYRFDIMRGELYFHSSQLNQVLQYYDVIDNTDTWLLFDCYNLGYYYYRLLSYYDKPGSIKVLLVNNLSATILNPQVGTHEAFIHEFDSIIAYVNDDAFTKTTQNGYDIYTLTLANSSEPEEEFYDLFVDVIMRCQNGRMVDYKINGIFKEEDSCTDETSSLGGTVKGDAGLNNAGQFNWVNPDTGHLFDLDYKITYQTTKKVPQVSVPEDVPVLDLTDFLY